MVAESLLRGAREGIPADGVGVGGDQVRWRTVKVALVELWFRSGALEGVDELEELEN